MASDRQIARTLGVSPGTVRNRVGRLIRSSFLQGISVYGNPHLLGLLGGSYAVVVSPSQRKTDVTDRLARIEGLVFFENFRRSLLGIGMTYENEGALEQKRFRIDQVARSSCGIFTRVTHPPCAVRWTRPERKLVSRLMAGSFRTYEHLAGDPAISVRTLKRRLARLDRSGAVLTFPMMDFRAITGGVAADLLVSFDERPSKGAKQTRVLHLVEDWTIFAGVWETYDFYRLILPNVARATELAEQVGHLAGVRSARVEFVEGRVDWLETPRLYVDRYLVSPTTETHEIAAA
jgi:DNA-binding Lrp family transcriptional regulator